MHPMQPPPRNPPSHTRGTEPQSPQLVERQGPVLALGKRQETSLARDRVIAPAELRFIWDRKSAMAGHAERVT
jgi:hypothetical protein